MIETFGAAGVHRLMRAQGRRGAGNVIHEQIITLLDDYADTDPIRINWADGNGSAIVTAGELRAALADQAIDSAEIESLQLG
jgi:hypothetical protein